MQAQDLGLERARDHRWRLTSRSPTQRTEPRGGSSRAALALLVALTGTVQRLAPAHPRTLPGTVLIAAVAVPTDAHLLRAAPATVQPIGRKRPRFPVLSFV